MIKNYTLNEMKIEITHDCPLNCIHCSSDSMPKTGRDIAHEKCIQIINQAISMGIKKIAFSGGEPLICDWLTDVVELSSTNSMDVSIYTCGNIDDIDNTFKKLKNCGLKTAIFSIYSNDEKEHERVTRVRGSFQKTLDAIKSARNNDIIPELHFVALKNNYMKIPLIAELAKKNHVHRISILRFVPQGRGALITNYILNKEQNLELREIIIKLRKKGFDIRTGSPLNFLWVNENPACYSAIDRLIISPNLRIYPCDAFKQIEAEEICGSVEYSELQNYTLYDCWEKSYYFNRVRQHLNDEYKEPCSDCHKLSACLSGCLAQKFVAYGDLLKFHDPNCLIHTV